MAEPEQGLVMAEPEQVMLEPEQVMLDKHKAQVIEKQVNKTAATEAL